MPDGAESEENSEDRSQCSTHVECQCREIVAQTGISSVPEDWLVRRPIQPLRPSVEHTSVTREGFGAWANTWTGNSRNSADTPS